MVRPDGEGAHRARSERRAAALRSDGCQRPQFPACHTVAAPRKGAAATCVGIGFIGCRQKERGGSDQVSTWARLSQVRRLRRATCERTTVALAVVGPGSQNQRVAAQAFRFVVAEGI